MAKSPAAPWFRTLPKWRDRVALPQHFAAHGYRTLATGKIYHGGTGGGQRKGKGKADDKADARPPEFQVTGTAGGIGAMPNGRVKVIG